MKTSNVNSNHNSFNVHYRISLCMGTLDFREFLFYSYSFGDFNKNCVTTALEYSYIELFLIKILQFG